MTLRKRWRDLDRAAVGAAPRRYGYYELGDEAGEVLGRDVGVLQDDLKEALAYGDAAKVRWEAATSEAAARRLRRDHDPDHPDSDTGDAAGGEGPDA